MTTLDQLLFPHQARPLLPKAGRVLIAHPAMTDRYFKRSVVYLVKVGPEGSVGFVLNKDSGENMDSIWDSFPIPDMPFGIGGPVQLNTIHFIHSVEEAVVPGFSVDVAASGIWWDGNLELLQAGISNHEIEEDRYRFFVGYAGWDAGQLEREIAEQAWVVSRLPKSWIMEDRDDLWTAAVKRLGPAFRFWLRTPFDPHWN